MWLGEFDQDVITFAVWEGGVLIVFFDKPTCPTDGGLIQYVEQHLRVEFRRVLGLSRFEPFTERPDTIRGELGIVFDEVFQEVVQIPE